jgi:hypothetical protein
VLNLHVPPSSREGVKARTGWALLLGRSSGMCSKKHIESLLHALQAESLVGQLVSDFEEKVEVSRVRCCRLLPPVAVPGLLIDSLLFCFCTVLMALLLCFCGFRAGLRRSLLDDIARGVRLFSVGLVTSWWPGAGRAKARARILVARSHEQGVPGRAGRVGLQAD